MKKQELHADMKIPYDQYQQLPFTGWQRIAVYATGAITFGIGMFVITALLTVVLL